MFVEYVKNYVATVNVREKSERMNDVPKETVYNDKKQLRRSNIEAEIKQDTKKRATICMKDIFSPCPSSVSKNSKNMT